MARRSQPARLSWPLTLEQLARVDEMFQELYDDTDNGSLEFDASQMTTGTLTVPQGAVGITEYVIGDILYASETDVLSTLAGVATGNALISGGVGAAPSWGKVELTTHVSGVLPVASGGTNISSYTIGDLLYASAAGVLSKLAAVATGSYLRAAGAATAPVWSTLTLPNASAQGDLFYSTAANAMTVLAKNASATRYLSNTGASNDPAWAQVNLSNGVTGVLPVANGGTAVSSATQTYTATVTIVANLDAVTSYTAQYLRIGTTVVVSGKFEANPTLAATMTQLRIALPVASNFAAEEQLGGTAFAGALTGEGCRIYADATNDAALVEWMTTTTLNQSFAFIFAYQVI
jgi:hypothetical protein